MNIKVSIWDKEYGKFINETITEDDLAEITKQKVIKYYNIKKENLVDFEIDNIEM